MSAIVLVECRIVRAITVKKPEPTHLVMHYSPGTAAVTFCDLKHSIRRLLITTKND
jgi:hypothetical protein